MAKLAVFSKPNERGARIQLATWELDNPNVQTPQPALTWWVEQPQDIIPLMLVGRISMQDRPIGTFDVHSWIFDPHQPRWEWRLDLETIAEIERRRQGHDLHVSIHLDGLASVPSARLGGQEGTRSIWPIEVEGRERFAQSDWARWLIDWNYNPIQNIVLPLDSSHWPDWSLVQKDMQGSLLALGRGEGHEALTQCLSALEKLQTAPYSRDSWNSVFAVDDQKQEGLRALFAGLGTYLNKVGYHRSRNAASDGENPKSPVDHWEAELAVAMTQMVLAYIRRLPRRGAGE